MQALTNAERWSACFALQRYELGPLCIRPFRLSDLPSYEQFIEQAPEMTWDRTMPRAGDAENLLKFRIGHYSRYNFGVLGAWDGDDLAAQVGLQVLDDAARDVELVVFVARDRWGHGLASQLCHWILDKAFSECGVDEVFATVRPENVPALRLAARLGFQPYGDKTHYGQKSLLFRLRASEYVRSAA